MPLLVGKELTLEVMRVMNSGVFPVNTMKAYWGMELLLHTLLALAPHGGVWSAS